MNLCQPGGFASCGACCGLYNFKDHDEGSVRARLSLHTEALRDVPRTREAFSKAAAELKARDEGPLFPLVRVCPLLGFLDGREERIGCLAHPSQNDGVDLRDCGVYTSEVCESFTCPSYTWLSEDEAALVKAACGTSYLYGLVITDVDFVKGAMKLIERELARPVGAKELRERALPEISALFSLKGRKADGALFGRFEPVEGEDEPRLRTLDYASLGEHAGPEDDVVLCLGFSPKSAVALDAARREVRSHIQAIAKTFPP